MVQAVSGNRRRIVLHFDINNTILMKDAAMGINNTTEHVSSPIFEWSFAHITICLGLPSCLQVSLGKTHTANRFTGSR